MPDVVIVGGGIVGCATAYYLAKVGAKVTVLERGEVAGEASGAAAGMLAMLSSEAGERGQAFDALIADAITPYPELLAELAKTGVDVRHRRTGIMHVVFSDEAASSLRTRFDAIRAQGIDARWFDHDELLREEPQLNPRAVAAYVTSDEEYVDPQRLTQALAEAAQSLGATILPNSPVTRLNRSGRRVSSVSTPVGSYQAEMLLLAAGPWTFELAKKLGAYIPIRPIRGQMLSLEGPATPLRHMIWADHAYLVPREDGQTFVGATVEDLGYRKHTTTAGIASLRRGAAEMVPSLATAKQRRAWAGLRPAASDGLPVMGQLPGWENAWVSTGHFRNGILLGPISGELVANSIIAGERDARLEPFSPTRFLD